MKKYTKPLNSLKQIKYNQRQWLGGILRLHQQRILNVYKNICSDAESHQQKIGESALKWTYLYSVWGS